MKSLFPFLRWAGITSGTVVLLAAFLLVLMKFSIGPYLHLTATLGRGSEGDTVQPALPAGTADDVMFRVYPGKETYEIKEILKDTVASAPTGPKVVNPPPFSSRHVNISEKGYREIRPQRTFRRGPAYKNVFVFGGSTTWGYGLPDGETIPAHLQAALGQKEGDLTYNVFNYGVCASYSRYEKRHLERLIEEGRTPDYAVFIDGLNEFCRLPLNRPREDGPKQIALPGFLFDWVVGPFLFWKQEIAGRSRPDKDALVEYGEEDLRRAAGEMAANWKSTRGICEENGITCIFALQPVPVYGYPLEKNLFLDEAGLKAEFSYYLAPRRGYALLLEEGGLESFNFLDLHRLEIEGEEYLDTCHYTSAFSRRIAEAVAERIVNSKDNAGP